MFLVAVAATALLTALVRGGRLAALAELELRALPLAFVPLVAQLLAFSRAGHAWGVVATGLHLLSYGAVLGFFLLNPGLPGRVWLALGAAANALVIAANGGAMPVSERALTGAGLTAVLEALRAGPHHNSVLLGPDSRLAFLGDTMWLPAWVPLANVFSLGDLLIAAGLFVLLHTGTRRASAAERNRTLTS
jgi:hypothetical protein